MRAAIMQPYFFPYLGHFALIAATDRWVVFDTSQYTPRSWMNRNRVLHPTLGTATISIPLARASIHMRTHEAVMADPAAARRSVLGSLSHYRRIAPHYPAVVALVHETFDAAGASLVQLNVTGLAAVCRRLGLPFDPILASTLALDHAAAMGPGDWAPTIAALIGATSYLNPIGGAALFDPAAFARRGIDLLFADFTPIAYATRRMRFQPNLSILDVLMWNDPATIVAALASHTRLVDTTPPVIGAGTPVVVG